ncbi:cobalt-zinc-cadmium efflux system protein [Pseudonocardia sediminis]|uniref:Cobalt-zinc-cadmium efflux system protein n=1 Tax=Pseudonocardia sediminis TaxID=1397368 RepID=A0A4V2FQQ0_PSEST|nr:cation diffusion facilitator family transporter [Pseudonocardia sediminis]RZT85600.1 cobalt-zinc-cadmium efflux system protein [Pseudonocardia sediminis]
MGHGHGHGAASAGSGRTRGLTIALALTASYMVVQVVVGLTSGSLALLSDAAHMGTDVLGLGLALAAMLLARRPAASQRTFGNYRLEVLAAVLNGILLFAAAAYVFVEAIRRIADPAEVSGVPVLIAAVFGLIVNIVSMRLLAGDARESLNVKGAYLEVMADMIGSIGVIVAALIVWLTGWFYADTIIAAAIGLFILPRTYVLMRHALRILMEVAPPEVDVDAVERDLRAIDGVADVHDLHIWTITSGMEAATVHVLVTSDDRIHPVLDQVRAALAGVGVTRSTVQVEPVAHGEDSAGDDPAHRGEPALGPGASG